MPTRGEPTTFTNTMARAAFDDAEVAIARGQNTFLEVGRALLAIRDGRGYRHVGYATFAAYMAGRWSWSRQHGYELIWATEVASDVRRVLQSELTQRQALELARVPRENRIQLARDLPRPITDYSSRELRQIIAERQAQRRRDARDSLASTPPLTPDPTDEEIRTGLAEALPWADGSVDLVVTSPPYALGIDYADGGDYDDYGAYRAMVNRWCAEMLRISNPEHGRICVDVPIDTDRGGWRPVAHHWQVALEAAGWMYRSSIVWNKAQAGAGTDRGSLDSAATPNVTAPVELVLVYYRGSWSRAAEMRDRQSDLSHNEWLEWCGPRGVWNFPGEHDAGHPAVFPDELARRCIKLFSLVGDVVADPFSGRGTTVRVAAQLNRRIRAIDRSPLYVARAQAEVAKVRATTLDSAEVAA